MRNFLRNTVAALGIFLSALAAVSPAFALTNPPTFAPRNFQTQQTHYLRAQVNFTSCVFAALTCSVKVGNVPYNAFMVRAFTQTTTTWATSASLTAAIGTGLPNAGPYNNLMTATTIQTAGNAIAQTVVAGGLGETVTGNGATPNGQDGGFDIYVTLLAGTSNPTAGQTTVILEYIAPNDGACINYPLTGPTGAC
jgi:hypothetical protein